MSDRSLPPGIYKTKTGYRAIVAIAAGRKERRFPRDASLTEIKRWRQQTIVKLETRYPHKRAGSIQRGTFSADVKRYLSTLAIASWASRRSELRAWEKRFGKLRRARVTSTHVAAAIKAWSDAKVPPKTIQNRLRALTAMIHALDGPEAWTPADHVPRPKVAKRRPAIVPLEVLRAVEIQLRPGSPKTHARYMVLISTGCRPVHLKRAKPADVDLEARIWHAHGAKDGNPIDLYLNDDMLAAWQAFIAADAWGDFNSTEYAKALRAAGWPAGIRPYNAKHTFGYALGEAGIDHQDMADWFGHTDVETTRLYVPVLDSRIKNASQRVAGRLGWGMPEKPPQSPQGESERLAADLGTMSAEARIRLITRLLRDMGG